MGSKKEAFEFSSGSLAPMATGSGSFDRVKVELDSVKFAELTFGKSSGGRASSTFSVSATQARPCSLISAILAGPMPIMRSMSSTEENNFSSRNLKICAARDSPICLILTNYSFGAVLISMQSEELAAMTGSIISKK